MSFRERAEALFTSDSSIAKDLKMNLMNLAENSSLAPADAALILLALGRAKRHSALTELGTEWLKEAAPDLQPEQIREAEEVPAIGQVLNTYYKFRHFMKNQQPERESEYGPARLRMQSLGNPKLGKERFEMLVLAVSIMNGCEPCVNAHEKTLAQLGVTTEKLHDIARFTATVNAVAALT